MKSISIASLIIMTCTLAGAQEFTRQLSSFNKVVASPRVALVLKEGAEESVTIQYDGVEQEKIIVKVSGNKLRIYLEDARFVQKDEWIDTDKYHYRGEMYEDARVTAYVTYKKLKGVEVRGSQRVTCESHITSDKFKVKAYGENELRFRSLDTKRFRVYLYGDNQLRIANGETGHQKYSLYGDNRIDARGMTSATAATTIYGDGNISLNTVEELRVNSFGDPNIILTGSPVVSRGIIFGGVTITKR